MGESSKSVGLGGDPASKHMKRDSTEKPMKTSIQMLSAIAAGVAVAQQLTVEINKVTDAGVGEKIGTVAITEDRNGTAFKVAVNGIPAGKHGFHVHEKGNCAAAMKDGKMEPGGAAGAHYDPDEEVAQGSAAGHKGDLPALTANATGVNETVTAPKLKLSDVQGRALVIHEGGDNYSDNPENGGQGRIACGVVPKG